MSRLNEIKKFYQDATWKTDEEYIDHTWEDVPWLVSRVERYERALKLIAYNPALYGEIRTAEVINPEQFAIEAREALAEE